MVSDLAFAVGGLVVAICGLLALFAVMDSTDTVRPPPGPYED